MANVLLVAYLLIVLALIAVILLQRSEGGGLGMGGGGGGGLVSARGSANLLSRTTAILAALFMVSAIALTILSGLDRGSSSILDSASEAGATGENGAPVSVLDALNQLQGDAAADTPAPAAPAADDALNLAVPTTTPPANGTAPASGN